MIEGKVKGAEVEKKERNPKEVDLDPGQEIEEETGPGQGKEIETVVEMTTEKEVEEIVTDHQGVREVQGNTDPIHLLGLIGKRAHHVYIYHYSDEDWRSSPPNNTIMIRGLPLYVTEQHVG